MERNGAVETEYSGKIERVDKREAGVTKRKTKDTDAAQRDDPKKREEKTTNYSNGIV